MAAGVTAFINVLFVALDRYAFPDRSGGMLGIRLALECVLVTIFARGYSTRPVLSMWAVALSTAAMLLTVVYGTGAAPTTDYYVGLMLFLMGMPVLVPVTGLETALVVAGVVTAFAVAPIVEPSGSITRTFVVHAIFLLSGGLVAIGSAVMLDRGRYRDFCRRREIERARDKLEELDEAKSRFTANIHHELRTPLTLTLAPLEAMLAGEFGEVSGIQRGYLETMHKNSLRLLKLINNLLDHARIESGQMEVRPQPLDVERVVEEIVESARPMAERKRVELVAEVAGGLPSINADPDAVEKVVVNLVGNALKFTDPGGRITVRVAPMRLEGGASASAAGEGGASNGGSAGPLEGVELRVSDTGIGLPPEQLERVFDRFAQVDGSATRRHEGTGIGLSLVRELAALHGGHAWATSEGIGHGAQFHVFLPIGALGADDGEEVVQAADGRGLSLQHSVAALAADIDNDGDEDASAGSAGSEGGLEQERRYRTAELERTAERFEGTESPAMPADATPSNGPRAEVVVAEDNADMRRLLTHLLGAEFAVRPARNGREALDLVRGRAPALVVTDVMMPEMSGTELCEAIKGDAALAGIPVMLVTSKAEREMKILGLELGADDYVTKPFHPRELLARARSLVRLRLLQEELAEQNAALERALAQLQASEVALVQAERLAAVGELAAGIAHEVNNPVNFALNSLRALRETVSGVREFAGRVAAMDWRDTPKLPERALELQRLEAELGLEEIVATLDELVGIVIEGLERTSRLVADLRDFGAPGERPHEPVDVRTSVESSLGMVGPLLTRAGVRVEQDIAPDLPPVLGDPSALKQLLLNLLKNAAESLEETGGTVRVSAARSPEGSGVVVSVADDGPGIAPDVAARIFEPFYTTKPAGRGTGLGLSICRRIAEAHHGALEVASTPGAGATFTLRLPAEASNASAARA